MAGGYNSSVIKEFMYESIDDYIKGSAIKEKSTLKTLYWKIRSLRHKLDRLGDAVRCIDC